MLTTPRITACLIARNESPVIGRALNSLCGQVDEIIVVDGGSTDDTVAIARAAGARVVVEPWRHDFAHARNAAVSAAIGDWVLVIDCDETLQAGGGKLLRAAIQREKHPAWIVQSRSHTAGGPSDNEMVRLGRRDPTRRFVRSIHEHVEPAFESIGRTKVIVQHWPSSVAQREAKFLRNIDLLDRHLTVHPEDLYCRINRMHTQRALAHPQWCDDLTATFRLIKWSALTPTDVGNVSVLLELALMAPRVPLSHAHFASIAARWFPRNCVLAGLSCWRWADTQHWTEAIAAGERAQRLWQTRTFDASHPFDPSFLHDQLPATLAHAHRQLGQSQAAKLQSQRRVKFLPAHFLSIT
jgi:hypothetical protein